MAWLTGTSTAQGDHSQLVHSVMTEVGQSLITTGFGLDVNFIVVYNEVETQVLASGSFPEQAELSVHSVWPFTPEACHWTSICGIQQK